MQSIRRVILSACLAAGLSAPAQSQNPAPAAERVYVITYIDVTLAGAPRTIGLLQQYHDALAEGGNNDIGLYQELGQPGHFAVMEEWPNRAAYDAQPRQAAMDKLRMDLNDIQVGPPDSNLFQGETTGAVKRPAGGRARLWTISHFEIQPARLAEFDSLANPFAQSSRTGAGFMRFDILRETAPRQNQFAIVEGWSSPQAAEAHRVSADARKFRAALAPMLAGPFDDRVYGKFN